MTPIVFLNTALVGAFAFVGLLYFYLWRTSRVRSLLLISLYSFFSTVQMVGVVVLTSTKDLGFAQTALETRATDGPALVVGYGRLNLASIDSAVEDARPLALATQAPFA